MKTNFTLCGLALLITTLSTAQTKHFVKQASTGTGTGLSWANAAGAAQLQGIIAGAASGDTVWVAAGVYHPTAVPAGSTGDAGARDVSFTLTNGVAVYGGFAGTETNLNQRNVTANVTSLSGDIGVVGTITDNCYHVISTYNVTNTAILDGFKIDSGYANGASSYSIGGQTFSETTGAGICDMKSQPTIANCTFVANQATGEGGAIYLSNCNAMPLTNCAFTNNSAGGSGGAISKETSSPLTFTNCTFTNNHTSVAAGTTGGGAIYSNSGSGDKILSCTFSQNGSANAYGGAIFFNGTSTLTMTSTVLSQNNAATFGGGLANIGGTSFVVSNCNINNNACANGGGIYSSGGSCLFAYDTLANNTATSTTGAGGGGFYNDAANPIISHCILQGNVTNGGNGAGQYDNGGAAPIDSNTVFQANIAKGTASNGGGYYHAAGTGSFVNCVFVNNACTANGGGYYNNSTQPVSHCTFYNNAAGAAGLGGGFYDVGGEGPKIYNNMIWGNTPNNFYCGSTASLKLKYNDFPEAASYPAGGSVVGNIAQTPTFLNTGNYTGLDGKWGTIDDGLHLISAAGTGGADGVPPNGTNGSYGWAVDDIAETLRPDAGADSADMGAYEGDIIILPVTLLQFSATPASGEDVLLTWALGSAVENDTVAITRSLDGHTFTVLGAESGSADHYTDVDAPEGMLYYQLQILSAGGVTVAGSGVVWVDHTASTERVQLRPNLVEQRTTVLFTGGVTTALTLQAAALDTRGRTLFRRTVSLQPGDNYTLLDLGGLPRGLYYLVLTGTNGWRRALPFEKE